MGGTRKLDRDVRFIRLLWCDAAGVRRCRVVPRARFDYALRLGVGLASACMFLPAHADAPPPDPAASPVGEVRLVPDLSTLRPLPWNPSHAVVLTTLCTEVPTPWECCPRTALARALRLLAAETGAQLVAGFEVEFTLLKQQPSSVPSENAHRLDLVDALVLVPIDASVYCQSSAVDAAAPVLDAMCGALEAMGQTVEQVHGESAGGQFEIVTRHGPALAAADALLLRKEAIAGVAHRHAMLASFLPKLFPSQAGNGCHCHLSLRGDGARADAMADAARPHGLSELGERFVAGVLRHLPALLAFVAPSPNSYRRIAPSSWAGAYTCWGWHNREAPLRVVGSPGQPGSVNCELKPFDAAANPHLGLTAVVAAGILGVRAKLQLPAPVDVDPAALSEGEREERGIRRLPATLDAALRAAEGDAALVAAMQEIIGGEDLVRAYLAVKRSECAHFGGMSLEEEACALHSRY